MNNSRPILEVCGYNIQTCIIAVEAGASRIELCSSPAEGGVTPGYGIIKYALDHISIPFYVMIRPRGGNFVYDAAELDIMQKDIVACKEMGCKGIAIGILTPDNNIDVVQMKKMVALAAPMGVTCHKAFDRTTDANKALEDVIAAGCERILTSGLSDTAETGSATIAQLIIQAKGRIIIMPGGGVRSTNIQQIAQQTGAAELHSSGLLKSSQNYIADRDEIVAMVGELNGL